MKIKILAITKHFNNGMLHTDRGYRPAPPTTIRLEAELGKDENLIEARIQLEKEINRLGQLDSATYRKAKQIIEDPFNFSGKAIQDAKDYITKIENPTD